MSDQQTDASTESCLKAMATVLGLYQDIEDVLADEALTSKRKLAKIAKLNAKIGKLATKHLPG